MFFNDVYLSLAFILVLSILFAIYPYIKKRYSRCSANNEDLYYKNNENQIIKVVDLILNFLLRFSLIPLFTFSIFSLPATIMMTDAGINEEVNKAMQAFFLRCWLPPIIVLFVIIISSKLREKDKIILSMIIEIIAILVSCYLICSIFVN